MMAWDSTKTTGDLISSADYNSSVTDQKTRGIPCTEVKAGSNCTGLDGSLGRVLTLANTIATKIGGWSVFRNGARLSNVDVAMTHLGENDMVTFVSVNIFDDDELTIIYFE
jgi:hypothetical protein